MSLEHLMDIMGSVKFAPPDPALIAKREAEIAERERERELREQRYREESWRRLIPRRYHWARPEVPELAARVHPVRHDGAQATPGEAIAAMLAHPGVVVLRGPPGAGKTSLLVAALRAAWDRGDSVAFADAHLLGTARIQHAAGQGEAPYVERAMQAELLALDDLGQERQTQNNAVADVLLQRHAEDLPTWITTGEGFDALAAKYGGGVARRIREGALVIRCEQGEKR